MHKKVGDFYGLNRFLPDRINSFRTFTFRFIFILLGPVGSHGSYHEIGRAMATLMSDEVFHEVAYKARKRDHLLAGIDEFLDAVTVLPPGEWGKIHAS